MRHLAILIPVLLAGTAAAQRIEEKPERTWPTSVAVITDLKTLSGAREAIAAYRTAIEADGLSAWLVADDWPRPDAVREVIARLRGATPPLEGAVFIGRVPVPMIRDAQHLTSSFKMDQERYPRRRSSVPSDRLYEDLDLRFDFLGRDEKEPALFYYSLAADSPQRVEKEIYSARILPGEAATPERLRAYLDKVVRRKREQRPLLDAVVVTGHGYNSGATGAWAAQGRMFREQMPWLFRPGGRVRSYFHADHRDLESQVLAQVERPELNLLVFHAHGAPQAQYLLGLPPATTVTAQIDAVKRDLRNRLRQARKRKRDVAEEKAAIMKRLGVPESWFEGAFDEAVTRADEAAEAARDLEPADLAGRSPAPEVVVFDECFNGRFIEPSYVAGAYVFAPGGTVAAVANSVNVLQDMWADEFLGLVGLGLRLGRYHRLNPMLESHLIGDPTFRFRPRPGLSPESLLGDDDRTRARLNDLVDDEAAPPALRALAVHRLHRTFGEILAPRLRALCLTDRSDVVRLTAFECLVAERPSDLAEILRSAARDPAEMIRRQGVRLMGDLGDPSLVRPLLLAAAADPSRRVVFQAQAALNRFAPEAIAAALKDESLPVPVAARDALLDRFGKRSAFLGDDLARVRDSGAEPKARVRSIRTFRLYRLDQAVEALLAVAVDPRAPEAVRIAALEALGWYTLSRHRSAIEAALEKIPGADPAATPDAVRAQAARSLRRLAAGPNHPFTP